MEPKEQNWDFRRGGGGDGVVGGGGGKPKNLKWVGLGGGLDTFWNHTKWHIYIPTPILFS